MSNLPKSFSWLWTLRGGPAERAAFALAGIGPPNSETLRCANLAYVSGVLARDAAHKKRSLWEALIE
jgi:hypothetical protein